MLLGRATMLIKKLKSSSVRRAWCWETDDGSSPITFFLIWISNSNGLILPRISGNFSKLEQCCRFRDSRDSTLTHGNLLRRLQYIKFNLLSFVGHPREWWTSSRLTQLPKSKYSKFGISVKSGVCVRSLERLRSRILRYGNCCNSEQKKDQKRKQEWPGKRICKRKIGWN